MPTATSNEPPFGRGQYQPFVTGVAAAEQAFYGVLGQEWEFDDLLWDTGGNGPPTIRSSAKVRVRLVKNNTGSAILPKKACKIDPANAGSVTALCSATNDEAYPADEFLPAAGVPDKGIFWVVTRGLAKALLPAADPPANITAGDFLNPGAVTTGSIDIVNTFTANKALFENIISARFKATADVTASGAGGTTITVEMCGIPR